MRDASPPAPPPRSPAPSRLRRTLHTLRSPFRSGSPFHIASIKRSGSTKSSASDGDSARDENTMRKKNKKQRAEPDASGAATAAAAAGSVPRSADHSPREGKKKEGFVRRLGSMTRRKDSPSSTPPPEPGPSRAAAPAPVTTPSPEPTPAPAPAPAPDPAPAPAPEPTPPANIEIPKPLGPLKGPESPTSPIAVEHPVATRPFTKAAWKRKSSEVEMEKPVEEPSPENALRRRIAFVTQASACFSEDHDDGEGEGSPPGAGGEVGSLQEAVALARVRLAAHSPSSQQSQQSAPGDTDDTEEEGFADAMPPAPYGALMEAEGAAAAPSESQAAPSGERREHLYKILVIGELGTGKTSIIKRYVHQFFSQHYRATIGVDFALKVLNWDANTIIRLQLWDIAGQERFGNMTRVYYKEAVGAFIVFDVSRQATFDAVVKWKNDLDGKVQLPDGSPIPCILLANKCDQQKEGIVNQPAKMDEYCKEKGFAGWFETSAKENINIEEAARSLVNKILLNDKLLQSNDGKDGEKFSLDHKIANGENSRANGSKSCAC